MSNIVEKGCGCWVFLTLLGVLLSVSMYIFSDGSIDAVEEIGIGELGASKLTEYVPSGVAASKSIIDAIKGNKDVEDVELAELSVSDYILGAGNNVIVRQFVGSDMEEADELFDVVRFTFAYKHHQVSADFLVVKGKMFSLFYENEHVQPWATCLGIINFKRKITIFTDNVDEIEAVYISLLKKKDLVGNWAVLKGIQDSRGGSVTRLATDDAHETNSRLSRDFLFLDFSHTGGSTPSINIASAILSNLDNAKLLYSGPLTYNVFVDGLKKGSVEMTARPTPSERYMYLECKNNPELASIYHAMLAAKRIELVNVKDSLNSFPFDIKGLVSAVKKGRVL
jgi:hypothetical protein